MSPNSVVCPHLRRFVPSLRGFCVVVSKGNYLGKEKPNRMPGMTMPASPLGFFFCYLPSLEKNNFFAIIKTEPGQDKRLSLEVFFRKLPSLSRQFYYFFPFRTISTKARIATIRLMIS